MNAQKYFEQHTEELIASFAGKNAILFFRGFVPANVRWLAQREDAILPAAKVLNADGTISIAKIDAAKRKLVQSLMMQEEGVTVGIYEEMLAVLQTVQDPKAMFDAEFIVVDNNAFPAYVPSCIPVADAEVLYKAYETEKTEFSPEAEVLSRYYAAVRTLDERYYVALFNRHQGENISCIPFYQKKQSVFTDAPATLSHEISPLVLADQFFSDELDGSMVLPVEREQNAKNNTYDVLSFVAAQCGATFALNCAEHKEQVEPETINRYRAILKQYWGANADFRMLDFYKDPAAGTETMQISQGEIISTIVKQCELALDGYQDYSNVFLTAPTGAGKSAFYQVSGIYLAQVHQAVTLVITPLIALMQDQVSQLEARGVHCATFLNSNVSHEEREERLNAIHKGEKSILYIAPEMLLTTSLETLLGGRRLGLFVVDEAHTVTSWGRDFRADYWFMGDYLERQRKNGLHFPVLCLTATAVFGGRDDVVQDTISTLGLNQPILYLGRVRRDNIDFDIHSLDKQTDESRDEFKVNHVAQKIAEYVAEGKKTLVYCPFRSTVDSIYQAVPFSAKDKVRRYHAGMERGEKNAAQDAFKKLPEQYYVARDYQVYSLFHEMMAPLKKLNDLEKVQLKHIAFDNAMMNAIPDQRKFIRDIKKLIKNDTYTDYFTEQQKIEQKILELYGVEEILSKQDVDAFAQNNQNIAAELQTSMERAMQKSRSALLKSKPAENVSKCIDLLMEVDTRLFPRMEQEDRDALQSNLSELSNIVAAFQKKLSE